MNDYKVGQFGHAVFIAKKGWQYKTDCYGTITAVELKYVQFTDNDGNEYIIPRSKFQFEACELKFGLITK